MIGEEYTITEGVIDLILCVLTIIDMVNTNGIYLTMIVFCGVVVISYLLELIGIDIQINPRRNTRYFIRGYIIGRLRVSKFT